MAGHLVHALASLRPRSIDDPVFALRGALAFVAAFGFTRGWRYTVDREPVPLAIQFISPNGAVLFWGVLWFIACGVALIGIPRAWPLASLGVVAVSLAFAVGFTITWLSSLDTPLGSPGRADYANASTYWTPVGLLAFGYVLARGALRGTSSASGE